MKKYENSFMVVPEDLNHHGTLFAGKALLQFTQTGFVCAAMEEKSPDEIVCLAINDFTFKNPVPKGSIITYTAQIVRLGITSLTVYITGECKLTNTHHIEGMITYVSVDAQSGKKKPHGLTLDEAADETEKRLREKAKNFFEKMH